MTENKTYIVMVKLRLWNYSTTVVYQHVYDKLHEAAMDYHEQNSRRIELNKLMFRTPNCLNGEFDVYLLDDNEIAKCGLDKTGSYLVGSDGSQALLICPNCGAERKHPHLDALVDEINDPISRFKPYSGIANKQIPEDRLKACHYGEKGE